MTDSRIQADGPDAALDEFVEGLIGAAAGNAGDGEPGGTIRAVPPRLVAYERELTSRLRRAGVGFSLTLHLGNLSARVLNDQRAIEYFKRRKSPADSRCHTGPGGR